MRLLLRQPIRKELLGLIALFLLLCIFILANSPTVLLHVGHDVSPILDGAWRLDNQQVPHKDFPSILGHGYLLQQDFFLNLFHFDFIAFAVSSITCTGLALLALLSFYTEDAYLKTGRGLRVYLFLLLMCLGLGQYHFGVNFMLPTYANLYNRYCFLFLLLFFIQTLLLKDSDHFDKRLFIQFAAMSLLLSYLFYVKLTYFIVAVGWLTVLFFVSVISFKIYGGLLLISAIVFVLVTLLIGSHPMAMLHDYQTISAVRGKEFLQLSFVKDKLLHSYNLAFLLSWLLLLIEMRLRRFSIKHILLVSYIGIAALALQFSNWGKTDIVLFTFIPVIIILVPEFKKLRSCYLILLLCGFFLFKNLFSIYYLIKATSLEHSEVTSPYLSRFYTDFRETGSDENYAEKVMSGVALLNKYKRPGDHVFSFSFDNPFPFLTQTGPPKQVPLVWQFNTTYNDQVYPDPQRLFSEVQLVLVSRNPGAESATEMWKLYGEALRNNYSLIDSNSCWYLYQKAKELSGH